MANGKTASFLILVNKLLIYQSRQTLYYDDKNNYAEDLLCGDIEEQDLKAKSWLKWNELSPATPNSLYQSLKNLATYFSNSPLTNVAINMVDKFMSGDNNSYKNNQLTSSVANHTATRSYITSVISFIKTILSQYNGNLSRLKYYPSSRDDHLLKIMFEENEIYQPAYSTLNDYINGLAFCLHGLWGNKIEVTSYNKSGNNYTIKLLFTLYDHFGLDEEDVRNFSSGSISNFIMENFLNAPLEGFSAWYILQHNKSYNKQYKPFPTIIEISENVSGTI